MPRIIRLLSAIDLAAGYLTAPAIPAGLPATARREEDIQRARTANPAGRHAGIPTHRAMAERALRFILAAGVAGQRACW